MSEEPRHVVIERWLETQCEAVGVGGSLPTETAVAERFGVSRMTARRAFERLAHEGRIERRRRAGTVVLPPALRRQDSLLRPFSDEVRRRGMSPRSHIVSSAVGSFPDLAARLGLNGDDEVVRIVRVRFADEVAVALERTALPGRLAGVLDADLTAGSLHAALTRHGHAPHRAQGTVQARMATTDEAELLDLDRPAALLVESRVVMDRTERIIEFTETSYAGTRWVMDTGAFVAPATTSS